jgi:hypothetical protein
MRHSQIVDAVLRSLAAICIGIVGYWLPFLWAESIKRPFPNEDFDDRLGSFFLFTLPIILCFAIRAGISQIQAYRGGDSCNRKLATALVICGFALCWSPFLLIIFGSLFNLVARR